jgi:hypothetical protein
MPACGDRNAPQFDSTKPHELRRYFTDLEFLMTRAAVTVEAEMKRHITRFLSVEDQEIWEALPSFADTPKSFAQFKADVLKLYAGNEEDRRFELSDLDSLVGQYSRVGILTLDDLKMFYRQLLRITMYLLGKKHLSESEQSRPFLRAMQPLAHSRNLPPFEDQKIRTSIPPILAQSPTSMRQLSTRSLALVVLSRLTYTTQRHLLPPPSR